MTTTAIDGVRPELPPISSHRIQANLLTFGRRLRDAGLPVGSGQILSLVDALATIDVFRHDDVYHAARASVVTRPEQIPVFDLEFSRFWRAARRQTGPLDPFVPQNTQAEPPLPDATKKKTERRHTPESAEDEKDIFHISEGEEDSGAAEEEFEASPTTSCFSARGRRYGARTSPSARPTRSPRRAASSRASPGASAPARHGAGYAPSTASSSILAPPSVARCATAASARATPPETKDPHPPPRRHLRHLRLDGPLRPAAVALRARSGTRSGKYRGLRLRYPPDADHPRATEADVDTADPSRRLGRGLVRWDSHRRGNQGVQLPMGAARSGATVVIISDGWDRGDPRLLGREMACLQRSCRRLIWLNPLLGAPGYQPLTQGMRAAMPYIDEFLPIHNLQSLEALADLLGEVEDEPPVRRRAASRRGLTTRPPDGQHPLPLMPETPHVLQATSAASREMRCTHERCSA